MRKRPMRSKFICAMGLLFLLIGLCSTASATIYLCRDSSGSMNFTNVPNSDYCKSYSLEKKKKRYGSYSSWAGNPDRSKYDTEIRRSGKRYDVDPPLIKAIIHTESDFDPRAVSKAGAKGLMQLMPETAMDLKVSNPFNPTENIDGGTRYFRKILDKFDGNLILSLAAYNAGPGLVSRIGRVPRITETRRYVNKVLKHYKTYKSKW